MTYMIHRLERDCVTPLGIPVDNLSLEQTVSRIIELAKLRDGRARLVSTLNVDFLVNALGTRFSRARHPELLDVLRHSDLVTADGFPVVWLSRLVGRPVKQRVCGSDLVPALAPLARDNKLSIFLLGGGSGVAKKAAKRLEETNPGLKIAGIAAPYVYTAGPELANCYADDEAVVDQINRSGADILLLGLGNPKQELWFNRNRQRLQVPVSIGVGGTFEFIIGTVRRAPAWVRRLNLEWVYRIFQDPVRLWRRYAHGLIKLAALSLPLAIARLSELADFMVHTLPSAEQVRWYRLWSNRDQSLAVLRLPTLVGYAYLRAVVDSLRDDESVNTLHLLDFSAVRRVELKAHQLLLTLGEMQQHKQFDVQCLGISPRLRRDLSVTRAMDAVQGQHVGTLEVIGTDEGKSFSCRSYALHDGVITFIGGEVSASEFAATGFIESLGHASRDRDCYIDLRGVTLLHSSAIVALSPFFQRDPESQGGFVFSGINAHVRQMFVMAGLGMPDTPLTDQQLLNMLCGEVPQRG
ncbi:glycosyl transferase [Halioglobus japonicus]|uniref:Glycosyl transferase n=1 Tax=Halioglobus japonicus TaxID=930805 RepID=A0AAP8MEJ4_9GAMM|nr:WecB/TagA/CpsF family glycosyltransferase [Halioglobus japonicus]AQA18364.1 glycosyl transferase [Halioglobus japonicus]PLW86381.1 glycosyl transferase [Halioglobus japonicus]GHD13174.1 hypothetical protein GCM10007052_15010 [Halioglobus japonicus]